ncbi:PqiC family protein [Longibacter sp.]|uniref:PqiC family protein n=1 Tax=Longibacter sp. TaxID=2045415 RepID=UPI003EBCA65B
MDRMSDMQWHRAVRGTLIAILGLSVLVGCVNLEPRQSNINYYVLSDAMTPVEVEPGADLQAQLPDSLQLVVGIRKIRLAAYLKTPSITTRYGRHAMHFSEFHRWGEDLGDAVSRSIAQSLARRPEIRRVDRVPWPDRTPHDVLVQLRVLRFEGEAPPAARRENRDDDAPIRGSARVAIAWELVDPETEDVWVSGQTDHREDGWPVGEYPALVERLDAALTVVAADLAAQMEAVKGLSALQR